MIEKKSLQPMTVFYIILAITTFTLTLGGLLLLRPNFTPSQSVAIEPTSQRLPEVATTKANETSELDTSVNNPAISTPTVNKPEVHKQSPVTNQIISSPTAPNTQVATPEEAKAAPQELQVQTEPSKEVSDEEPKKEKDTSLIGALLNVIGAIL